MRKSRESQAVIRPQNVLESFTYMEIGGLQQGGPMNWELKKTFFRKIYAPMLTIKSDELPKK